MPKLGDDIANFNTPSNFGFSGVRAEDLEASEYTLVTVVVDCSYSIDDFVNELVECLKTIFNTCNDEKNPRRENLLLRLVSFSDSVQEEHGFKLLGQISESDYDNAVQPRGATALYDGAHTAVEASLAYARDLSENQGITVNAINFILTDGADNRSRFRPNQVAGLIRQAKQDEYLESILNILVGVNTTDQYIVNKLNEFNTEAGFDQFVDIGAATKDTLLRLAEFVSRSISSQSQSLGTGGPSKTLTW